MVHCPTRNTASFGTVRIIYANHTGGAVTCMRVHARVCVCVHVCARVSVCVCVCACMCVRVSVCART